MFLRGKVYMSVNYIKGEAICFVILVHNVHKKINSSTCLGESEKNDKEYCQTLSLTELLLIFEHEISHWFETYEQSLDGLRHLQFFLATLDNFDNF